MVWLVLLLRITVFIADYKISTKLCVSVKESVQTTNVARLKHCSLLTQNCEHFIYQYIPSVWKTPLSSNMALIFFIPFPPKLYLMAPKKIYKFNTVRVPSFTLTNIFPHR